MFDVVYSVLATTMAVLLLVTVITAPRRSGAGPVLVAAGFALILAAGVGLNELMRSGQIGDLTALQLRFVVFYIGFALILAGSDRVLAPGGSRALRWSTYVVACVIAALFLFVPSLIASAPAGDRVRVSHQVVHYLPLFVGGAFLAVDAYRARNWWLESFILLIVAGIVRESGAIPSFGDAYLDLLGAFVPFTLAALCLAVLGWSRTRPMPAKASR